MLRISQANGAIVPTLQNGMQLDRIGKTRVEIGHVRSNRVSLRSFRVVVSVLIVDGLALAKDSLYYTEEEQPIILPLLG